MGNWLRTQRMEARMSRAYVRSHKRKDMERRFIFSLGNYSKTTPMMQPEAKVRMKMAQP